MEGDPGREADERVTPQIWCKKTVQTKKTRMYPIVVNLSHGKLNLKIGKPNEKDTARKGFEFGGKRNGSKQNSFPYG